MTQIVETLSSRVPPLQLALPKGRMQADVFALLGEAGIPVAGAHRGYRPSVGLDRAEVKLLKPQNAIRMLVAGTRDVGFAGADWVEELDADVVELLDTRLSPVRVVAAAPRDGVWPPRRAVVASEYEQITRRWMGRQSFEGTFVRSFGATEVFPPEDADCIVDNTATGETLRANGLVIVDEVMRSSTRLYASREALRDRGRRGRIEDLVVLLQGVLEARSRVVLEVNVASSDLSAVLDLLPCLREPTVGRLAGEGYAVKVAAPRDGLAALIPRIRAAGGSDIIVVRPTQIVR
jgi:ATP phosphoribosyltransferase